MADTAPDPEVLTFERECIAASVDPVDVLARVGMHRATWFRWKAGTTSPTIRRLKAAQSALAEMARGRAA